MITDHFRQHLGTSTFRPATFHWHSLGYQQHDLSSLEAPFTQEEIKDTIFSMPNDKAPGPVSFTGIFFKECWEIIKFDLTAAFNQLHNLNAQQLNLLNSANIILIPKKMDAKHVGDYRPISLIHSFAKIFSKLLANRLVPHLNRLVLNCQSAFIKRRCIQDNFLYLQSTVRRLHRLKKPALFLKLDIQKAFDTINWSYLLEILQTLGFGPRWREWISFLFSTAMSRALLNGSQGDSFEHKCGVRQGDPLSPMLFILAIYPLQKILDLSKECSHHSPSQQQNSGLQSMLMMRQFSSSQIKTSCKQSKISWKCLVT